MIFSLVRPRPGCDQGSCPAAVQFTSPDEGLLAVAPVVQPALRCRVELVS